MSSFKTLPEMLKESVKKYKEKPAFKVKEGDKFVPISYEDFYQRIKSFGTGLLDIGIKELDHIGLISENRLEWIISDLAIIHLRAVDVPCSGNSSPKDIYFKLNHSDATAAILEGEKQLANFLQMPRSLPDIKNVILLEKINLFCEKDEAPEWGIPIAYIENNSISKKFEQAANNFIRHQNTVLFLSPDAKKFLEQYLENNQKVLDKSKDNLPADFIKESILQRVHTIDKEFNQQNSFKIYSFQHLCQKGQELLKEGNNQFEQIADRIKEDDLATIIYTSGTTADPKGVMLIHSNFVHNIRVMPPVQEINGNDRFLSVLPSWHIFERTAEYLSLTVGASTAYSKPFKQILLPDLAQEQPTIMTSVPRIWESVYQGAVAKARRGSTIKKKIFDWAFGVGARYKEAEKIANNALPLFDKLEFTPKERKKARKTMALLGWQYKLADMLVYKKIREVAGGKLRFAISGGGALPDNVDKFFDIAGIFVCEGYGLTETSPVLSARNPNARIMSTVGVTMPEAEIKIVDKDNLKKEIPNGQTGIILTKGPMVMQGYYKNEQKTAEVIQDGWFNTGDLGRKTKNGKYLQLVGRSKDTIVLRGGENVEPQPLEEKLLESEIINMAVVVGQDKPRLGVLIVPNFDNLKSFWAKEKTKIENLSEYIKDPKIISLFQQEVRRLISRENGFNPYETVMGLALFAREFSVETGELTETLKVKRFEIHKKFEEIINKICG
ncbi:MAG: long-chain fatty acid--CoA ligase [Atribacterota bacterium]|nr:long-chain fatty acid--CoA ligase [Atribacterota bacterium]MDD5637818.1 long-chain fatty acid--CoA ligase [Atribacterota bacterium]